MEPKKKKGRQRRPVVQIDPNTLQVVRQWDSTAEAQKGLGLSHVDVAVAKLRKAGGFYWCWSGETASFPERLSAKQRETAERQKAKAEMMRRGWQGKISLTINVTI